MSSFSRKEYDEIKSNSAFSASNNDTISGSTLFDFVKRYDPKFKPRNVNPALLNAARAHRDKAAEGFQRIKVTAVLDDLAAEIKKVVGVDTFGEDVYINSSAFNHIEKRHGVDGKADHSMSDLNDLARVGYIIDNADSVEPLMDNGKQVYSKEFRRQDGSPAPLVLISKKINGTYYCAIAAADGKWNRTWVTTAFINKKEELPRMLHAELSALGSTSETTVASSSSDEIISEGDPAVNSDDIRYGVVVLDRDIFKGVKPRDWGKKLSR